MQAHTQLEFEASVRQGASSADRLEGEGWLPLTCQPSARRSLTKLRFFVDGSPEASDNEQSYSHNFDSDTWSRHMVQIEGMAAPALVFMCTTAANDHQAFLGLCGSVPPLSANLQMRIRSLGYVGSFLREYGSAADLLRSDHERNRLLRAVASPRHQASGSHSGNRGTFVPAADNKVLDTSEVPLNASQRAAVLNLGGGLDIIVGPPGKDRRGHGILGVHPSYQRHAYLYNHMSTTTVGVLPCISKMRPRYVAGLLTQRRWYCQERTEGSKHSAVSR